MGGNDLNGKDQEDANKKRPHSPDTPRSERVAKKFEHEERSNEEESDVMKMLREMRKSIDLMVKKMDTIEEKMDKRLEAVENDVKEVKINMAKVNDELTEVDKEVKQVNKECKEMGEELTSFKTQITKVEDELNKQDRLSRKNNVRISGLKEVEGENVMEVVRHFFSDKFGEEVKTTKSYRVGRINRGGEGRDGGRPILVTFSSFEDK